MTQKPKLLLPLVVGLVLAVGLVAVGVLHAVRPRIEIEPISSVGPSDPFPDDFRIKNMGTLQLYDVTYSCADYSAHGMSMVLDQPSVRFLDAGQTFTIRCGGHDPDASPAVLGSSGGYRFVSDVEIHVGARRPYAWFYDKWNARFIGVKDPDRPMIWVRQPLHPRD